MVREMVRREGLPSWVALIPKIESGYNPRAVSRKGAAGLWQLMPETARSLGLRVEGNTDERFDPVKSTKAALSYIKRLYEKYKNPELVLIAYNWGEGNLLRAGIDKVLNNPELLPHETRAYLERFKGAF
ncbi:MAG: lytic transglycosylase domain-containing protein [Aquificota bacterium]|nr:lytic transglycosylase domain-containing protein [Aquificota bacterium]